MSVRSDARGYQKSSKLAWNAQTQAAIDAGSVDPHAADLLSRTNYQVVPDAAHPNGKLQPKPDASFLSNFGKYFALPVAGGIGAILAAPAIAGAFGAGGGGAAAGGTGAATGGTVTTGGGTLGHILGSNAGLNLIGQGVGAFTNIWANNKNASAQQRAAELEAHAAAASLDFLKQQEATRQQEFQSVQDRNYQLYQEQQARLAPYRAMGAGAIRQLGQPIPGSLGAIAGAR